MSHRCLPDGELALLLAAPPDAPARAAAAACPRCAAHLAALTAFLAGDPQLPPADLADADRSLGAHVARLAARSPAPVADRAAVAPRRRRATRPFGRWAATLGACAAVATVTLVLATRDGDTGRLGARLRGGEAAVAAPLAVEPPRRAADGALELRWLPHPGADAYAVEVYTLDLDTLRLFGPLLEPAVTLPATMLRDPRAAAGLLWRLRALRDGATAAANPLQPLPMP